MNNNEINTIKYFVICDVHGFYSIMMKNLCENGFEIDNKDHRIILLGDAFDRGKEVMEMYNFLVKLKAENRLVYVKGNHEDLLEKFIADCSLGRTVNSVHYHNGTTITAMVFSGEVSHMVFEDRMKLPLIAEKMSPLRDFIRETAVDYFELGNKIFVHGWIPKEKNWRKGNWRDARWENGMNAWRKGKKFATKTIFCGHFHTSWGHAYIEQRYSEFGPKADFSPFIAKGIVAMDACTAFSGKMNVAVLDFNGKIIQINGEKSGDRRNVKKV